MVEGSWESRWNDRESSRPQRIPEDPTITRRRGRAPRLVRVWMGPGPELRARQASPFVSWCGGWGDRTRVVTLPRRGHQVVCLL